MNHQRWKLKVVDSFGTLFATNDALISGKGNDVLMGVVATDEKANDFELRMQA